MIILDKFGNGKEFRQPTELYEINSEMSMTLYGVPHVFVHILIPK